MRTLKELEEAVSNYNKVISIPNNGSGYAKYEIAKLQVADVLLSMLNAPLSPIDGAFPPAVYSPPKPPIGGFVYAMKNLRNGFIKIGFSTNPKARESTLQAEEPEIKLLHAWPGTRASEYALHIKYAAKRLRGEWFSLTEQEVEEIKGAAAQ